MYLKHNALKMRNTSTMELTLRNLKNVQIRNESELSYNFFIYFSLILIRPAH